MASVSAVAALKEEPRRSARATKGQNSDRWQEILDASRDNLVNPESVNGDGATDAGDKATPNNNQEEEGAGDDAIRCVCGMNVEVEDDDRTFVQCETCTVWQHAPCVGLNTRKMPDQYFCEQCRPDLHAKLLKRIQAGKPKVKVVPALTKQIERKRKRTAKALAQDENFTDDAASSDGLSDAEPLRKRSVSLSAESDYEDKVKVKAARHPTGSSKTAPAKKAKSSKKRAPPASQTQTEPFTSLDEIEDDTRKTIAKLLIRDVAKALEMATTQESFKLEENVDMAEEADRIGFATEFALYQALFDPSEAGARYKNQYRQIAFNLKDPKNPSLRRRVLNGSVSVAQLATMSSEDMANPELKAMAEQVREEGLKQSVLVQETGPRIRRTHKGEELVEGPEANDSVATSTTFPLNRRGDSDQDSSSVAMSPSPDRDAFSSPEVLKPSVARSSSLSGGLFSPKHERRTSNNIPIRPDDIESDSELHVLNDTPATSKLPVDPIWRGQMVMQRISSSDVQAILIGGSDDATTLKWSEILSSVVTVEGRLDKATATKYLVHQRYSQSKMVVAVKLEPQTSGNKSGLDALFDYFMKKDRYGVIKSGHSGLFRDGYLVPLSTSDTVPEFLDMMDNKTLPVVRTEPLLLAILVVEKTNAGARRASTSKNSPIAIKQPTSVSQPSASAQATPEAHSASVSWQQPKPQTQPQLTQPIASFNAQPPPSQPVMLAQEQQRQLTAFLQANPELASNPTLMSSPPVLAALLDNWLRSNGLQ